MHYTPMPKERQEIGWAEMVGQQKLRLRAIDTPKLSTSAGVRFREVVVEMLAPVSFVVLTTSRTDKYDWYLADVFCLAGATTGDEVLAVKW
jgi:endonuclease YncB( thermonuclease family)